MKKLKSSSIAAPLAPTTERGWGVRGIAIVPQRAFVFPHLERFFSLLQLDVACIVPLTPSPSLVGARGTEIV